MENMSIKKTEKVNLNGLSFNEKVELLLKNHCTKEAAERIANYNNGIVWLSANY
jgi:hypothetical protein